MAYKQSRIHAHKLIRDAKRAYLLSTASHSQNFWKTISHCTGLGRKRHIDPPWPRSTPTICKITSNAVTNSFVSAVNTITSMFSTRQQNDVVSPILTSAYAEFKFAYVTHDEVKKAIGALSSRGTNTLDKMLLQLLKLSLLEIVASPAYIFNMSINLGVFPFSWKIGQIVPVYKKGNRTNHTNYSPIALLPLLYKAMEHVVHQQIKAFFSEQHIYAARNGFRGKKSFCSALLELSNALSAAKNSGLCTAIAALDYSRAFDTINHKILLYKLTAINFGAGALSWFASYLSERRQYVCFNGTQSDFLSNSYGVPHEKCFGINFVSHLH